VSIDDVETVLKASTDFVQENADHLYRTGGLFAAYLQNKNLILNFLTNLVVNKNAVADLDGYLSPIRQLGLFQENYFNNLVLSLEVHLNIEDTVTKKRLLQVIDENVKPRQKADEFENFVAAYLFVRLQQYGAKFQQCSKFFAFLASPKKKEPNPNRALEKNVAILKETLPSIDKEFFIQLLDTGAISYLARIHEQLLAYPKTLKNRKPESLKAFEEGLLLPIHDFLDHTLKTFSQKNVKTPNDLPYKIDKAVIGCHQWLDDVLKGDVRKFNSTV
jgi:hypothetical protein